MRPPASASENRTHDAEKIGPRRYSDFFNKIDPSRQAALGRPSLTGHCGHGWTCTLPRPVSFDTPQPQEDTITKGLHRPTLDAIIPNLTAAGSHPDCRAVLIQIVALYRRDQRLNRL